MKKIIFISLIAIFQIKLFAQTTFNTFQRTYKAVGDEYVGTVIETTNGDFLTVGFSQTGTLINKEDALIMRTNKFGYPLWTKTYGDTSRQHFLHVIEDQGDVFYVVGFSEGRGVRRSDGIFGKIDGAGNILWLKAYGGNGDEELRKIVKAADGGFFLFGTSLNNPSGAGDFDNYIIKVNNTGDIQYTRLFGGAGEDKIRSAITDSIGNVVITGYTESFGAGGKDVYVGKMTQAGTFKWNYIYGKNGPDKAQELVIKEGGHIVIAGDTKMPLNITPSQGNPFLMKLDSLGNKKWTRVYEDSTETDSWGVVKTADNGYVFVTTELPAGVNTQSATNVCFAKVNDVTGNIVYSYRIAGNKKERFPDVASTADGGFMFGMGSASFSTDTMRNVYTVKTNSLGVSGCNTFPNSYTKIDTGFTKAPVVWTIATEGSTATVTWTPQVRVFPHDTLCESLIPTGISEKTNSFSSIMVYPNPSHGKYTIETSDENYKFVIRDILGKTIYSGKNESHFDLTGNSPGVYFITISNAQNSSTLKLVLEE